MGARSSIATLPPEIRGAVDAAIKRGATINSIVKLLDDLGAPRSRSAVGRYSKDYAELAARQRDLQATASAFASEFGEEGDNSSRLLIQLVTSIATRAVIPLASDEDPDVDGKELHFLARAVKDITSAAKTNLDREAKVREEAIKAERARAASVAEGAQRAAGASEDTIRRVRAAILGIDPQQATAGAGK